jgi:hypothetical protein
MNSKLFIPAALVGSRDFRLRRFRSGGRRRVLDLLP